MKGRDGRQTASAEVAVTKQAEMRNKSWEVALGNERLRPWLVFRPPAHTSNYVMD